MTLGSRRAAAALATLMSMAPRRRPPMTEFRSAFMAYVEWGTRWRSTTRQPGPATCRRGPDASMGLGRCPAVPQP